jgi:aminoglycoside phosphotransferase (APT) family kinase protein
MLEFKDHKSFNLEGPALVKAIKDDFNLEVSDIKEMKRGISNKVFEATWGKNKIFIRINENKDTFEKEILAYDLLRNNGIPVPKVRAYNSNPRNMGLPTIIIDSALGVSPEDTSDMTPEKMKRVYQNLGATLKKIHAIHLNGYGSLALGPEGLRGESKTWKEAWENRRESFLASLEFLVKKNLILPEEVKKIENIFEEISTLDIGKASLLHRDLHKDNFLIEGDNISGIIDLGIASAGDPRLDIASCLGHQEEDIRESFKKGYGDLANDPMVDKYSIMLSMGRIRRKSVSGSDITMQTKILHESLKKIG